MGRYGMSREERIMHRTLNDINEALSKAKTAPTIEYHQKNKINLQQKLKLYKLQRGLK